MASSISYHKCTLSNQTWRVRQGINLGCGGCLSTCKVCLSCDDMGMIMSRMSEGTKGGKSLISHSVDLKGCKPVVGQHGHWQINPVLTVPSTAACAAIFLT